MNHKLEKTLAFGGSIVLLYFGLSYALAWSLGFIALHVLSVVRERFYTSVLEAEEFSKSGFKRYILFVFLILWIAPLLAFIKPEWINPYVLFATYFINRFILFVGTLRKKESVYVSK